MSGSAHITSTDAVREFRAALQEYEAEIRDAIDQLQLELRRSLNWMEHDRARYWPAEARRASETVVHARQDLERCEMAIRTEDRRSCFEQKMALEKARQRLRLCEQKVRAVRRWRVAVQREADSLQGHLLKLTDFVDTEFPRALAALQRMAAALDKYTERTAPRAGPVDGGSGAGGSDPSSAAAPEDSREEPA